MPMGPSTGISLCHLIFTHYPIVTRTSVYISPSALHLNARGLHLTLCSILAKYTTSIHMTQQHLTRFPGVDMTGQIRVRASLLSDLSQLNKQCILINKKRIKRKLSASALAYAMRSSIMQCAVLCRSAVTHISLPAHGRLSHHSLRYHIFIWASTNIHRRVKTKHFYYMSRFVQLLYFRSLKICS